MSTALLVVDVQNDYLNAPGLTPAREHIIARVALLLAQARARGLPIAHIRTAISPDGSTAMPHRRSSPRCVVGTPGIETPDELLEKSGELVVTKQFFRGFVDPHLDAWLIERGVTRVIIAGLYTHACVRETVLDAYERGFEVVIAADAIASDAPAHAIETLEWIGARAARVLNESDTSLLIDSIDSGRADATWEKMRTAQLNWALRPINDRVSLLEQLIDTLSSFKDALAADIVREVGKPLVLARSEIDRAIDHVRAAISLADRVGASETVAPGVEVSYKPLGVIAAIMPWNNPIALPISKIAPALLCGNAVVFKPSPFAMHTAKSLCDLLRMCGIGHDLVRLALGDDTEGARLVRSPSIDAVTFTGSIQAGRAIARECVTLGKPVQGELGGNNAAIVLPDAQLDEVVPALANNAFSFAGQRCTAVRRFVVHEDILESFIKRMRRALVALAPQNAFDETTLVGPVISEQAAKRILLDVSQAHKMGTQTLVAPSHTVVDHKHFVSPGLILARDPDNPMVQNETFGPIAVIQPARDLEHAIELANGVEQGLVQFACTNDRLARTHIAAAARAGILQFGAESLPVHPDAPFAGWKASSIGTPEHGRWDLDFYQRPQTSYSTEA